jgi:putative DNA primase/helicase
MIMTNPEYKLSDYAVRNDLPSPVGVSDPLSETPDELKRRPQWVVWRSEDRSGKPTKVPYDPKTGVLAKTTDLMTWGTFDEALKALGSGRYSGVGFVFCSADPFTGVDLDKCRDLETGELTPEARDILDGFEGAYTEVSPSGTGVHIIARGKLPVKGKRRGWIEAYSQDRYFTITGRTL